MSYLKITGLSKAFGKKPVLDGLDLEVRQGECLVIFGGSGSGKTTVARAIHEATGIDAAFVDQDAYYKDLGHLSMDDRRRVNFDHPDALDAATRWLCGRSPSDGEGLWAAAVSRLCFVHADRPDSPVHGLADEARAVAELVHDEVSPTFLDAAARAMGAAGTVPHDMAATT